MKVKSFKFLPGVQHQGDDHGDLQQNVPANNTNQGNATTGGNPAPAPNTANAANTASGNPPSAPAAQIRLPQRRNDVDTKKFKDKFVLSIDGERVDPGHGIVVEVHAGLATFIVDSERKKYRPSMLCLPDGQTPQTSASSAAPQILHPGPSLLSVRDEATYREIFITERNKARADRDAAAAQSGIPTQGAASGQSGQGTTSAPGDGGARAGDGG
jgi:hypothetical protein